MITLHQFARVWGIPNLSNVLWCPIESPLKEHAQGVPNLVAFCERVRDRYFAEDARAAS